MNRLLLSALASVAVVLAQKPVINPGGVVNGANFVPVSQAQHAIAPGSIASIFGQDLATTTARAPSVPLPIAIAGTSVTVNGQPAPVFYVSPGQINFQVPQRTPFGDLEDGFAKAHVAVTSPAGTSDPVTVEFTDSGPAIFTQDTSGCGRGAVLNVKPDGTVSLNSPSNSAAPGDFLEIFGTGFNATTVPVLPDGAAAPADAPLSVSVGGTTLDGVSVLPFGAGWQAPGLVGVDQINVEVSSDVREGCAVPLQSGGDLAISQPVLVSIRRGGGQCVDPPVESYGQITWRKIIVANATPPTEADVFTASFPASPGRRLLEARAWASAGSVTFNTVPPGIFPLLISHNVEITVDVGPDPAQTYPFSAPGLTLGGQQTWHYDYHFPGLTFYQPGQ